MLGKRPQPLSACTALAKLYINNPDITDVSPLSCCPSLTVLALWNCAGLLDLSHLAACTRLERLSLSCATGLSDIQPLASCTYLHWLFLGGCSQLVDISPLASCTCLERFVLDACKGLVSVRALAACTSLERLTLPYSWMPVSRMARLRRPLLKDKHHQLMFLQAHCPRLWVHHNTWGIVEHPHAPHDILSTNQWRRLNLPFHSGLWLCHSAYASWSSVVAIPLGHCQHECVSE